MDSTRAFRSGGGFGGARASSWVACDTRGVLKYGYMIYPEHNGHRSKPRVETHGHERPLNRFADVA